MLRSGFTLIELSIVLVIIGLVVGGVLIGQDLISAASIRSQISEIEKLQIATNTFRLKYGGLPGDLRNGENFGFTARGQYAGQGDGNGILDGVLGNAAGINYGNEFCGGETVVFWVDLSTAGLIDKSFDTATNVTTFYNGIYTSGTVPSLEKFSPAAKIRGNYIYVWSKNNSNYLTISGIIDMGSLWQGLINGSTNLTVMQAYSIDTKLDDGLPQYGNIQAYHLGCITNQGVWAGMSCVTYNGPYTTATAGSATTCFDNRNIGGAKQEYSTNQNNGVGLNCALTFTFK
jgi:prepilin-type N-terminal cleavage/methylation domain-containing protein